VPLDILHPDQTFRHLTRLPNASDSAAVPRQQQFQRRFSSDRHNAHSPLQKVRNAVKGIRRLLILIAGVTGMLALVPGAAYALIAANHTEPLQRS
jgi:hypothetical protein